MENFEGRKKGGSSPPSSFRDDPEAARERSQLHDGSAKEKEKYSDKEG
jgi:hypothetical protein